MTLSQRVNKNLHHKIKRKILKIVTLKSNLIYRAFLVLGFLFFSVFVMLLLIGKPDITGPLLISGFVSMAIAFRGYCRHNLPIYHNAVYWRFGCHSFWIST